MVTPIYYYRLSNELNGAKMLGTLYEGFRDFLRTHPKGLEQWKLNNQDKNIEWPKGSEPQVDGGPFKRIPNVRNFRVKLGMKNKLLAMFGIEVKFHPTFSYEVYNNLGMNKYMNNQIYRMRKLARENPKLYFKTMNNLLRYSKVLFIMGLHHVEPRGHRDIPLGYIYKLGKSHCRISQLKELDVRHHRLYINKANGKKRPLGVPEMVGRIYLHQVANFLSLFLEERQFFGEEQHGFRTRLGTKTAGQAILEKVTKADGVFEFDLERCFPNIHIKGVSKALRKAGVVEHGIRKLEYLNLRPVDNPQDLRSDTKEMNEGNKGRKSHNIGFHVINLGADEMNKNILPDKVGVSDILLYNRAPEDEYDDSEDLFTELYKGTESDPMRGLPQGLPTSPLLTIASLQTNFIERSKWKMIMYADDGIVYGGGQPPTREELITKLNSNYHGISINEEKSKFAKLPDTELDLKFLGMRLKGDILSAETRNGSRMVYDKHNLVDIYDMLDNGGIVYKFGAHEDTESTFACERKPVESAEEFAATSQFFAYKAGTEYWNRSSWEKLASSRLFGMIQSRLFQEGGNIPIAQCFELTYNPGSGVDHYKDKTLNVFNSTSIASYDLLQRLSRVRTNGRGKVAQGK